MRPSRPYYYERTSAFDRMLVLLLGLSCIFLTNLVARSGYGPAHESLRMIKELRSDPSQARTKPNTAFSENAVSRSMEILRNDHFDDTKSKKAEAEKKESPKTAEKKASPKSAPKTAGASSAKPKVVAPTQKKSAPKVPKATTTEHSDDDAAPSFWHNKYEVVHVLVTRFMQLQPDLLHLGKARIELFKTFTLRSIREQSTQEFLWIIFTDPELDPVLLKEVVDLVKIHKNILLVGMNVVFKDFRKSSWITGIEEVFSGDLQVIKDYQTAAQNHVYLETRIDADDAMYKDFMRRLQSQAGRSLGVHTKKANYDPAVLSKTPEFRVFCARHILEWNYINAWHPRTNEKGHLFGVPPRDLCITAGLSFALQVGTPVDDIIIPHHYLDKRFPQCPTVQNNTNCIDRIDDGGFQYVIFRPRTPTSAGMAGVLPTHQVRNSQEWYEKQDETWETFPFRNFAVTPKSILAVRKFMADDMENILQDALDGQCTRADFTCKESSKEALQKLLDEVKSGKARKKLASSSSGEAQTSVKK